MKKKNTLVVILGPTGIGKTELSIRIAKNFNTEIISADSRQFFKEMNIGVARPTEKELNEVKHHFIANISIHDNFSAGQFERSAMKVIRDIFCSHQLLLCTGGSGLYIDALLYGLDDLPADTTVKQELIALLEHSGLEVLQQELKKCDPDYAEEVDIQNPHRVIRALEVYRVSGKTYSSLRKKSKTERPFDYIKVGLTAKRKFIYDRINRRVDDMFSDGLEEEARSLYPYRNLNPLNTVGYKELFEFFDGTISRRVAIEKIKQHTRNFAKRQLTWWRRDQEINWIEMDGLPDPLLLIKNIIESRNMQ